MCVNFCSVLNSNIKVYIKVLVLKEYRNRKLEIQLVALIE